MAGLNTIIDLVHPTVSGVSALTTDQVWVLFDREMDETSITNGNFFLSGPDFDIWTGPDLAQFKEALSAGSGSDDILESPGYEGLVQGTVSFEQVDIDSNTTVTGVLDTIGSGHLFRTKAVFTPSQRLQADTTYTVHISADDDITDVYDAGVSARTVFDAVPSGVNAGTGEVTFEGGYTGTHSDVYHVTISRAGDVDYAKFTFYRDSDPTSVYGPFRTKRSGVLLSDCVNAVFSEGSYVVGDAWTVIVHPRTTYEGIISYPFKTGSGSITTLPTTTSTTVLGDIPAPSTTTGTSTAASFSVSSTSPADLATHQTIPTGNYTITATFNTAIDAATVVSGVDVIVRADPVDGSTADGTNALGVLNAYPNVSGSTLTITVGSGQLKQNNLVQVTLDSTIQSAAGTALGSDYVWTFTTTYSPLYCTLRRIRLDIGAFIQDVPDDTINFALHMASLMANDLTWNKDNLDDAYYQFVRQMWTCCKAQEILLVNTVGGSGSLRSKQLGDLRVEYDTSSSNTNVALQRAIDCQAKWEGALLAGGRQVQEPTRVVKGDLDPDRPPVGRGWFHERRLSSSQMPVGNRKVQFQGYTRYRNTYSRTGASRKGWWDR